MNVIQRSSPHRASWRGLSKVPAMLAVGLVRFYQLVISPWTASSCRYYPSCSAYAVESLRVHGALRGGWLAIRRLARCHPWTAGGVDHVPARQGSDPAAAQGPARRPGPGDMTTLTGV